MARRDRHSRAQFALWPDEGLQVAVASFPGEFVSMRRTELHHASPQMLTVELTAEFYRACEEDGWRVGPDGGPDPRHHNCLLRLTWESRWEGQVHFGNRIFAVESYEEFYAGPFGTFHPTRQGPPPSYLYEVVNDPSPWITEMLEKNDHTGVFPPYRVPVAVSEKARAYGPHIPTTGHFFPEHARPEDTGWSSDFALNWSGPQPPTPEELTEAKAEAGRQRGAQWQAQRRYPRYRHLLIASGSHILEVLCEDLPTWAWVSGS